MRRPTCPSWSSTTTPSSAIARPTPAEAEPVAAAEVAAFIAQLRALEDQDWSKPTDCTGWDVHDVAAHVTYALRESAKPLWLVADSLIGLRYIRQGPVNALNHAQVVRGRQRRPAELIAELDRIGPAAVRARRRFPQLLRRIPLPLEPLAGSDVADLMDIVYVRDMFIHRIDIAKAVGRDVDRSGHVAQLFEQVVRDLGLAWSGPPVTLVLTGEGGGTWSLGNGEPVATISVDAVEYLRLLAGREDAPAVEVDGDPAAADAVRRARVRI